MMMNGRVGEGTQTGMGTKRPVVGCFDDEPPSKSALVPGGWIGIWRRSLAGLFERVLARGRR